MEAEEGAATARRVCRPGAHSGKEILNARIAEDARAPEVVLRLCVDYVEWERPANIEVAANRAVAADVEIARRLCRARVLNVVAVTGWNTRHWNRACNLRARNVAGHLWALHTLNLAARHTVDARHWQAICRRRIQTLHGIGCGSDLLARRKRGETAAAGRLDGDLQEARWAVKTCRASAKIELHTEDAICHGDICNRDQRAELIAGAHCLGIEELELKIIIAAGGIAVVCELALISESRALSESDTRDHEQQQRC